MKNGTSTKKITLLAVGLFLIIMLPGGIAARSTYTVSAYDNAGNESEKSEVAATIWAASGSREDVAAAIDSATYGDTINIPPCNPGDCVWTTGITITKDIVIKGSGIDITTLTLGFTDNTVEEALFKFIPDATSRNNLDSLSDTHTFEVSGITFAGNGRMTNKFGIWLDNYNTPPIRRVKIYDCRFTFIHRAVQVKGYVHGVFYHNTLANTNGSYPQGAGAQSFDNDKMTLGSGKGWYIEDNVFSGTSGSTGDLSGAANSGGGFVVRYNTATGTASGGYFAVECHGNQCCGIYGPQMTEIYGNSINITGSSMFHDARGGKNLVFYNKYLNDDANDIRVREEYSDWVTSETLPNGKCADNPGEVQTCTDSCICQKVHDAYFFNNRNFNTNTSIGVVLGSDYDCQEGISECVAVYGTGPYPILNDPPELVENREYFDFVESGFDGTSGVGCGTYGTRPRSCSPGVGYWATDQSCSDLTGMVGANPTTPISGTLLKCTEPDVWTEWYTPYPYPHPLRSSAPSLELYGTPGDQAIHLEWAVDGTLPPTSTWTINYESPGTVYLPVTGILSPTRAYTLTDLTNGVWYTVTLHAMLDSTSLLSDTVRVMPTSNVVRFVYLPLVLKQFD